MFQKSLKNNTCPIKDEDSGVNMKKEIENSKPTVGQNKIMN